MKIALVTIATGRAYWNYALDMLTSATEYMPKHDQIVFSDRDFQCTVMFGGPGNGSKYVYRTEAKGYPTETLMRYHTILQKRDDLEKYDQIFYVDADMRFVAPVGDIFSDGLVATLHPGYVGRRGTPETRVESAAFSPRSKEYYCGGFQGGDARRYLRAMITMAQGVDIDKRNNITAIWHDESHWNFYLSEFEHPKKVLTPSYCYPEDYDGQWGWQPKEYPPVLVALDKHKRSAR